MHEANRTLHFAGLFGFLFLVLLLNSSSVVAEEGNAEAPQADAELTEELLKPLQLLLQQQGDDTLELMQPVIKADASAISSRKALAKYMTARILEVRKEPQKAYETYQEALEFSPKSIPIYIALIDLAYRLNREEEAIGYTEKAVDLDPENYKFNAQLGLYYVNKVARSRKTNDLQKAIQFLVKAIESSTIDKRSIQYVQLNQRLADLHLLDKNLEAATECFKVLYLALTDSSAFDIDLRSMRMLRANEKRTFRQLAEVFLTSSEYELSIDCFERSTRSDRQSDQALGELGLDISRVRVMQKQYTEALKSLEKYFSQNLTTRGTVPYVVLREIYSNSEQEESLLAKLTELFEQNPKYAPLGIIYAQELIKDKQIDKAEEILLEYQKGRGGRTINLELLPIYRLRKDAALLIDTFGKVLQPGLSEASRIEEELKAISESPELVEALFLEVQKRNQDENKQPEFAIFYLMGLLSKQVGDIDTTIDFFLQAIAMRRDTRSIAMLFDELTDYLEENKAYAKAAEVLTAAINQPELDGQKGLMLYQRSRFEEMSGQTELALKTIHTAQNLDPANVLYLFQEGWIYTHARDWPNAITTFNKLVEEPETEANARIIRQGIYLLSNAYVQSGNMTDGVRVLEEVYEQEPDDPSVNNDLGYLYADLGKNLEQAKKMISLALKADPENTAYLDSMGWVLFKLEEYTEAEKYLQQAVEESESGDTVLWDHLGDCLEALGKLEEAKKAWQQALDQGKAETHPDDKLLQKIEQKLNKVAAK